MSQEAIELEKALEVLSWCQENADEKWMVDHLALVRSSIDQALTLLRKEQPKPKCKTCGGKGKIPRKEKQHCRLLMCADLEIPSCFKCQFYIHEASCPDCKEQPPAGEFTKEVRVQLKHWRDFRNPDIVKKLEQACDRLDSSETKLNDIKLELSCPETMECANNKEPLYKWAALIMCNQHKLEAKVKDLLEACEAMKEIKNKIYGFEVGGVIKKVEAAIAKEKEDRE